MIESDPLILRGLSQIPAPYQAVARSLARYAYTTGRMQGVWQGAGITLVGIILGLAVIHTLL